MEGEWELVQNDEPIVSDPNPNQNSAVIRPDYFSLNPLPPSSCSSNSNSSELDRNFDDSYVANQLFPNSMSSSNLKQWNDSSDSDSDVTNTVIEEAVNEAEVGVGFESKEEEGEGEKGEKEEKEENNRGMVVWWKVPFEVLKYWVTPLPMSMCSLSVAAAAAATFLGLLFLGRRLYKMKRKTQTLKLNLALDDKRVSQLMGRVARLNEAFSVVRRVPTVRPSLPASTVTLRPVISMR